METDAKRIKILVLGSAGSGKTNLLLRYFKNTFDENYQPTSGSYMANRKFNYKKSQLEVEVLDVLGHQRGLRVRQARQELPLVRISQTDGSHGDENLCAKGGYVLQEAACGARRVTLLATGSEVLLALEARQKLEAQGIGAAVISLPCWELFDAQSAAYRTSVLGQPGTLRIGIEAAVRQGWDAYLGERSAFVGMRSFGASGPAPALYEKFGITVQAVVQAGLKLLEI